MKCAYCQARSGFFKNVCKDCLKLIDVCQKMPSTFGYRTFLETLEATQVSPEKIEKFLDADVDGRGSVSDLVTARMTNEIMGSLGQPSEMTSKDVKKVRKDIAEGRAPSITDEDVVEPEHTGHEDH